MSALTTDIIRMGNQIVDQYPHLAEADKVEAVATHVRKYWERRMLATLFDLIAEGNDELDPVLVAAGRRLQG